jgi:hypothetical protein
MVVVLHREQVVVQARTESDGRGFHVGLWRDERARGGERDHNLRVTWRPVEAEERSHVPGPNPCRRVRPGCSLPRRANPTDSRALARVSRNRHFALFSAWAILPEVVICRDRRRCSGGAGRVTVSERGTPLVDHAFPGVGGDMSEPPRVDLTSPEPWVGHGVDSRCLSSVRRAVTMRRPRARRYAFPAAILIPACDPRASTRPGSTSSATDAAYRFAGKRSAR